MSKQNKKTARERQGNLRELEINANILIDFSTPTSWCSAKKDKFTNFIKDDDSFFQYHYNIFFDLLPRISDCTFSNLYSKIGKHSHVIKDEEKIEQIKKIFIEMYSEVKKVSVKQAEDYYNQNFNDQMLYQIGDKGSLRLIGAKEGYHHFKLLFIDYYHLLFPSKNYNQDDTECYNLSLIKRGKINE